MSLIVSAVCIIFACLIGVWGGVVLRMHYEETTRKHDGKLIIVTDPVDGTWYTSIELGRTAMETMQNGDQVIFDVEVRQ